MVVEKSRLVRRPPAESHQDTFAPQMQLHLATLDSVRRNVQQVRSTATSTRLYRSSLKWLLKTKAQS
jgi:hypothetical protein